MPFSSLLADEVPFSCLASARRFDPRKHGRFIVADQPVGWIRQDDVTRLRQWPDVFALSSGGSGGSGGTVTLAERYATCEARSAVLEGVIRALADEGRITGWRDEIFAVRNDFDAPPLALIERAASRFFGTMTYAVHANGVIRAADGGPRDARGDGATAAVDPLLWIARRSVRKAVDPGMLDTLVGGGIGWGYGVMETLVKECWEESGVPEALLRTPLPARGRTIHILAEIEQGTQAEQLFVYDIDLPPDFVPTAQDGEVEEHRRMHFSEVLRAIALDRFTVDAGLVMLECALRRQWLEPAAVPGFAALCREPLLSTTSF